MALNETAPAKGRSPAGTPTSQPAKVSEVKRTLRLLLVDDHPVVRKGIAMCLTRAPHLVVVAEAGNGQEALAKARELVPDLVLLDVDMPKMSGLMVCELLRNELPQVKVLFLSMHADSDCVMRILKSGASGYVLKDATPEELARAIETVASGETYFSPDVAKAALNQLARDTEEQWNTPLTSREREVLVHIAGGLSNKEIASQLGVGVRTVETHRERIMRKLKIHSVAGLTRFAIAEGLVTVQREPTGL